MRLQSIEQSIGKMFVSKPFQCTGILKRSGQDGVINGEKRGLLHHAAIRHRLNSGKTILFLLRHRREKTYHEYQPEQDGSRTTDKTPDYHESCII